jgi:hypothetical protein
MRLSTILRRTEKTDVQPGYSYRREIGPALTEKVRVLDLKSDPSGIPHVRFEVSFERRSERLETARRILSLARFVESYQERIA